MRTARRAGLMAETSVTPTPTTRATITVRDSKTSEPDGREMPKPLSSASSPRAASTPRPRPIRDATSPTMAASSEHRTEHLAPAGAHDPQQRQLPGPLAHDDREGVEDRERAHEQGDEGEDEQGGREEPQRLVDVVGLLVGHRLPGDHLDPGRQDVGDGVLQARLVDSRLGQDVDGVEVADLSQQALGGRQGEGGQRGAGEIVGGAELDDAGDGEGPGGPGSRMRTWSPTAKWYFFAVASSITTSLEVVGPVPWITCNEESCGSGSKETPRVGAPPVLMALPSGATNCA